MPFKPSSFWWCNVPTNFAAAALAVGSPLDLMEVELWLLPEAHPDRYTQVNK